MDDTHCMRGRIWYRIVVFVWSTMLLKWIPIMYEYTIGADHKVILFDGLVLLRNERNNNVLNNIVV